MSGLEQAARAEASAEEFERRSRDASLLDASVVARSSENDDPSVLEARADALVEYGNSLPDGVSTEAFAEAENLRREARRLRDEAEWRLHSGSLKRPGVLPADEPERDAQARLDALAKGAGALLASACCLKRPKFKYEPWDGPCRKCAGCLAEAAWRQYREEQSALSAGEHEARGQAMEP